ncbi:DNA-binding protein [Paractinoplanes deccanensis]|uniref:DNA-binding protein n=1 Tax=Paractinoplanes deccanensis TaxID=113561 RepID=A0ABQ3XW39_9ACTN|nr:SCO2523 family variant P-loop protein [Actinoplanes deccanensis]GID71956.1 DNA-binding protein [Actinoplanes deccanensis]
MIVFTASARDGVGRSVTCANLLYRSALQGNDVCHADFDLGGRAIGALYGLEDAENGTMSGRGLHRYLRHEAAAPERVDVWERTSQSALRRRPADAGRLVLVPGDEGGAAFTPESPPDPRRCADLFRALDAEFGLCLVGLGSGRGPAVESILRATAGPEMADVPARWLVFHRWTPQQVIAASALVYGADGLLASARRHGHDEEEFARRLGFVRTAVMDPAAPAQSGLQVKQSVWLSHLDSRLRTLAAARGIRRDRVLGSVPLEPALHWQERILTDDDVAQGIAGRETRDAFDALAKSVGDEASWEML